jgi:hypothetical protein
MKDLTRKNRDWDNDNFIMSKHGKSIRENIYRAFITAGTSIVTYRTIDAIQKNFLRNTPRKNCGSC